MDKAPTTYREVIDLWRSRSGLAKKMGGDVTSGTVRTWYRRDAIPESRFDSIVTAAKASGFRGITYALLSGMKPGASLKGEKSGDLS